MKYIVQFTQVSHHKVEAYVEANSEQEAKDKARSGDSINEFDLGEPESWELISFHAKSVDEPEFNERLEKRVKEIHE